MAGKAHRGFGHVRTLPSSRYQGSYIGPDLVRHFRPTTLVTKVDAEAFLVAEHRQILMVEGTGPKARRRAEDPLTFGPFAEAWLAHRDPKPGTRELYRSLLNKQILSTFGSLSLVDITPARVRVWFGSYGNQTPAYRARACQALRAIFETAVSDEMIVANPCRVKGGGTHTRVRKVTPATRGEIQALIEAMPARLAVAVPLASFCALRFGEMSELRRKDIDLQAGVLHVRCSVVRVGRQGYIVGHPHFTHGWPARRLRSPAAVVVGPRQGRATGSALARPATHGGRARGTNWRNSGRTHGQARAFHAAGRDDLSARSPRPRRPDRCDPFRVGCPSRHLSLLQA